MSMNDVYVGFTCLLSNKIVELKRFRIIVKKKWKLFKKLAYFKIGSYLQESMKRQYSRFHERMNKKLARRDKFFSKFYRNGGEYQNHTDIVFKGAGKFIMPSGGL